VKEASFIVGALAEGLWRHITLQVQRCLVVGFVIPSSMLTAVGTRGWLGSDDNP